MAAIGDLHYALVADVRAAIVVQARNLGEGGERVELRESGSGLLDGRELPEDFFAEALKEFVFQLRAAFFRPEDFAFHVLQLGRDEALSVRDGLLADVMRRDFVEVR